MANKINKPRTERKENTQIYLPKWCIKRFQKAALKKGISKEELMSNLLREMSNGCFDYVLPLNQHRTMDIFN